MDRNHRERAVGALKRTSDSAKGVCICIDNIYSLSSPQGIENIAVAISPEGTRSTSGNLLPFKKGLFYMWEELQAPVVPMLTFGAFDLFPKRK